MISIIAAIGKNRELGYQNKLPWHLPDDFKRFKELTKGHTVIMGFRTYQSIGRPLPDRRNIVISQNKNPEIPGCDVVGSLDEAIQLAGNSEEVFVIGGAETYKLAMSKANRIYLTHVEAAPLADVFFPEFDLVDWQVVSSERHEADERHAVGFIFKTYERIH